MVDDAPKRIEIQDRILKENEELAEENKNLYRGHDIKGVFNLIGSPGAGKTSLLESIIPRLEKAGIIEGDIATARDAERVHALSVPVLQINTMGACHLDANMLAQVLPDFPLPEVNYLFIENVGNLVCPTGYDLGEDHKVVVLSLPEGEDKAAKYPAIFRASTLCVLNKLDLEPHCGVDVELLEEDIRDVNPDLDICRVSCESGQGIDELVEKLKQLSRR